MACAGIKKAPAHAGAFFYFFARGGKCALIRADYWMVRLTLAEPAGVVVSGNVVLPVTVKARAPLADAEVLASPR
jgi:hypothetical protein